MSLTLKVLVFILVLTIYSIIYLEIQLSIVSFKNSLIEYEMASKDKEIERCIKQKLDTLHVKNSSKFAKVIRVNVYPIHYNNVSVILSKESLGDTLAFNGQDYGSMQANKIHKFDRKRIFELEYGFMVGYNIYLNCYHVSKQRVFCLYNGSMKYQNDCIRRLSMIT